MKKNTIFALLLPLCLFVSLTFVSSAADYGRLWDEADLLSEYEAASITAQLDEISSRLNFDVVIVTVAPRYEGYHGAIGRTVFVGQPSEEYIALMKAQEKAQQVCASQFKPGNVGSEAEGMARAVMAEAGYDKNFLYSGIHSVGVIEFEPPILGPSSDTRFAENMVVSIDIPTFESPIGGARTEDGYIITADGCEHLTSDIPRIIIK